MSEPADEMLPALPVLAAGSDPEDLYGAFRETFLAQVQDPRAHAVIRAFGKVLSTFALESGESWPHSYADAAAYFLQAGLADLRHLQEHFASWSEEEPLNRTKETERHFAICQLSARIAQNLERLADDLEKAVGDWKFGG